MTGDALVPGRGYIPITTPSQKRELYPGRRMVYVRREVLPKTGGEWETFYSVYGGTEIAESVIMDGIIQRVRVKPEDLCVRGDRVYCRNVVSRLIVDEKHSRRVQSWLEEIKRIEHERIPDPLAR